MKFQNRIHQRKEEKVLNYGSCKAMLTLLSPVEIAALIIVTEKAPAQNAEQKKGELI